MCFVNKGDNMDNMLTLPLSTEDNILLEVNDTECLYALRTEKQHEKETARMRRKNAVKANDRKKTIMTFSPWIGPYYEKNGHIKNANVSRKYYEKTGNKKVRTYDKELGKGSCYKKVYDLWWEVW